MKEKGISQYKLVNGGIDNRTLNSLKKDGNITLRTLEKICVILDCNPESVVQFIKVEETFAKDDK